VLDSTQALADGSYRFLRLLPDHYRLVASAGGEEMAASDFVLHGTESRVELTLRVDRLQSAHVLVYDGDVGPADAAAVAFEWMTPGGMRRRSVSADASGYVCVNYLLPGVYLVRAKKGGRVVQQYVKLDSAAEEPLIELTIAGDG